MDGNGEQYKIGQLFGKLEGIENSFDDFKEHNTKEHDEIKKQLRENSNNISRLKMFNIKNIGFIAGVCAVFSIMLFLFNIIKDYLIKIL